MNIHKGCETVHYLQWHKYSSLDSEVNYLSQLLYAKWCNSRESSREMVIFFFLLFFFFHSIKHLLTEFTFTPVGPALKYVFLQSSITLCQDTEPVSVAQQWHMELHTGCTKHSDKSSDAKRGLSCIESNTNGFKTVFSYFLKFLFYYSFLLIKGLYCTIYICVKIGLVMLTNYSIFFLLLSIITTKTPLLDSKLKEEI